MSAEKRTLGVVLGALTDLFQSHVWPGIIDVARERNAGVILYSGKIPETPFLAKRELGVVYGFPSAERIDGMILFSSVLFNFITDAEFIQSIERYGNIPLISLARAAPGRPSVIVDSRSGMMELMRHFIRVHGYRRIAFIRGPEGSIEAEERFQAYCDALEEADIPYDGNLVVQGYFLPEGGTAAAKCLIEERKEHFDALVAANDGSLLGALGYLRNRWILFPGDIGVGGFDDVDDARFHIPPITTVSQSLYTMGRIACANLLDMLEGKTVPPLLTIPTRLVVRRSCGCGSPPELPADSPEGKLPANCVINPESPPKIRRLHTALAIALDREMKKTAAGFPAGSKARGKGEPAVPSPFLQTVAALVDNGTLDLSEREGLRTILESLETWAEQVPSAGKKPALERIGRAQALLSEYLGRTGNWNKSANQVSFMQEVSKALPTAVTVEGIFTVLETSLTDLGINYCLIAFPEGECAVKGIFADPSERSRLAFAWRDGRRIQLPAEGISFRSRALGPKNFAPEAGKGVVITFPLIYNDDYLGFMVCDYPSSSSVIISVEFLHEQLSAAVKTARMFEDLKKAQNRLIHTEKMASLGELTAGIAHELKNPLNFVNNFADGIVEYAEDLEKLLEKTRKAEEIKTDAERKKGSGPSDPARKGGGLRAEEGEEEDPLRNECAAILADLKTAAESISRHGKKADRIIRSMLNQARGDSGRFEHLQVSTLLHDAVTLAWQSFKIQCPSVTIAAEEHYSDDLKEIMANPSQLNRVFINLLTNALYALQLRFEKERRTGTEPDYRAKLAVSAENEGAGVRIRVTDNGIGIPEEILPHIFQPFFTTKPNNEGTGLGLKICRDIVVDGHGGTIDAESVEGVSTTFSVFLPRKIG